MIEFLRKFENRGIKIAWVNSIIISKSINLQLGCWTPNTPTVLGVRCSVDILKLSASAQPIYREVLIRLNYALN